MKYGNIEFPIALTPQYTVKSESLSVDVVFPTCFEPFEAITLSLCVRRTAGNPVSSILYIASGPNWCRWKTVFKFAKKLSTFVLLKLVASDNDITFRVRIDKWDCLFRNSLIQSLDAIFSWSSYQEYQFSYGYSVVIGEFTCLYFCQFIIMFRTNYHVICQFLFFFVGENVEPHRL